MPCTTSFCKIYYKYGFKDCKLNLKLIETISSYDTQQNNSNMTEKDLAGQPTIQSVGSHLQVQDHEVNLQAIISNPLSIGEVATTLTESQNGLS